VGGTEETGRENSETEIEHDGEYPKVWVFVLLIVVGCW
jgi:hypothetical protein